MWSGVWGRDESVFGDWSISLSHVLVDLKRLLFDWHPRPGSSTCLCIGESDRTYSSSVGPLGQPISGVVRLANMSDVEME